MLNVIVIRAKLRGEKQKPNMDEYLHQRHRKWTLTDSATQRWHKESIQRSRSILFTLKYVQNIYWHKCFSALGGGGQLSEWTDSPVSELQTNCPSELLRAVPVTIATISVYCWHLQSALWINSNLTPGRCESTPWTLHGPSVLAGVLRCLYVCLGSGGADGIVRLR